jgi:hypothetical protein
MLKVFARARVFAATVGFAAVTACGADAATATLEQSSAGPISLRILNTGAATLTNVSILVAENASPITVSELRPGQATEYVTRPKAHENPLVTLKADGRDYTSNPIEGFAGFNPALADGQYTIRIETVVVESQKALYVRVTKD